MRNLFFLIAILICVSSIYSQTEIDTDDERTIRYDPTEQSYYTRMTGLRVGRYYEQGYQSTYRAASTYDIIDIPDWQVVTDGYIALTASTPSDAYRLFITDVDGKHPPSRSDAQLYSDIDGDDLNPNGILVQTSFSDNVYLNSDMLAHFDYYVENGATWSALGFKSGEGSSEDNSVSDLTQELNLEWDTVMATSGELSQNERWGGSHDLTGNITVPSGITLTLWENLELDLNGYYIKSTGGIIEVQSGANFDPCEIVAQSGGSIQGYYSSLASAHSNTATGTTIYVYSSHTLTGNVDADYKTVRLEGGTLSLSSYELTSGNYGSIVIDGGSVSPNIQRENSSGTLKGLYPTIASAISDVSSGDEVNLGANTYTENVDMPGSFELSGAGRSASIINGDVTFDGVSSSKIINMRVNGDITVDGGSAYIHFVTAKDIIDIDLGSGHDVWEVYTEDSGYINLYSTESTVDDVLSYNSVARTIHANGSEVDANDGYFQNKTSWAVYAGSSSDIVLDEIEFCSNEGGGDDEDIYCGSGSAVDASGVTYFTVCPPGTDGLGTITLDTTCTACPAAKRNAEYVDDDNENGNVSIAEGETDAEKLFNEALLVYRGIHQKKRENRSKENQHLIKYDAEYSVAAQKMKMVLDNYSDSPFAVKALRYIDFCYRSLNRSDEFTKILNDALKKSISEKMTLTAKRLLVDDLLRRKEYADAVTLLDELIKSQDDVEEKQNLICRKGIIFDKYVKDYDTATTFYSQVIDLDAESPVAWDAQQRLNKMDRDYEPGASEDNSPEDKLEFAAHNYPNPANPGTSIHYALPEDGHLSIRIYNINGQQVAELLNAEMPAGRHQVLWNGANAAGRAAATGMYFYRLEFEDKVLSHKFLLLR